MNAEEQASALLGRAKVRGLPDPVEYALQAYDDREMLEAALEARPHNSRQDRNNETPTEPPPACATNDQRIGGFNLTAIRHAGWDTLFLRPATEPATPVSHCPTPPREFAGCPDATENETLATAGRAGK